LSSENEALLLLAEDFIPLLVEDFSKTARLLVENATNGVFL
jgi:hypothetical protein